MAAQLGARLKLSLVIGSKLYKEDGLPLEIRATLVDTVSDYKLGLGMGPGWYLS